MYFIILAEDKPDHLAVRMDIRPSHLAYAESEGCVVLAGPLLTDGADPKPRGSMLIIEAKDRAAAEAFAAEDPYAKAGLFAAVTIAPWMPALGDWLPPKKE
ncbi:YciI family protein [Paremcibacter congregatus]|uniref:YciI family protein n=1 Tax=Paremcibacter congregatus TaxID=2043170 RepID=UPI0030ED21A1|tara:strand:+ start:260 stop:562 length:303 start_codon:yes stop_codon:yes gene_type:complete